MPGGDVLIHAGDATNYGTVAELADFLCWFESLPHRYKVYVPGNHDVSLDTDAHPRISPFWTLLRDNAPARVEGILPAQRWSAPGGWPADIAWTVV